MMRPGILRVFLGWYETVGQVLAAPFPGVMYEIFVEFNICTYTTLQAGPLFNKQRYGTPLIDQAIGLDYISDLWNIF